MDKSPWSRTADAIARALSLAEAVWRQWEPDEPDTPDTDRFYAEIREDLIEALETLPRIPEALEALEALQWALAHLPPPEQRERGYFLDAVLTRPLDGPFLDPDAGRHVYDRLGWLVRKQATPLMGAMKRCRALDTLHPAAPPGLPRGDVARRLMAAGKGFDYESARKKVQRAFPDSACIPEAEALAWLAQVKPKRGYANTDYL